LIEVRGWPEQHRSSRVLLLLVLVVRGETLGYRLQMVGEQVVLVVRPADAVVAAAGCAEPGLAEQPAGTPRQPSEVEREDSHSYGALLHAELCRRFGPELVFLDSVSIPAGADFVAQLLGRVRQAAVVLAVIGSRWLSAAGPGGGPPDRRSGRLDPAGAGGGVRRGVRVIPVLTDGADMPAEAQLPGWGGRCSSPDRSELRLE
jgi:hypothetical protein